MLYMITVYLQGGLGNQLFQIYAYLSFCYDTGDKIILPLKKYDKFSAGGCPRNTYWDTLFKRLSIFVKDDKEIYTIPFYNEPFYKHHPLIKYDNDLSYRFRGYFQSWKYFDKHFFKINDIIGIENLQKQTAIKYPMYSKNSISMHFRIGDYKNIQDCHPLLSNQYYINSINHLIQKTKNDAFNIIVFFEKTDEKQINIKIKILKKKFKNINFTKINYDIPDWEQLLIMSNCEHNIIANSSFSWWGAYLNPNKNKIVTYPNIWFGKKLNHDTRDLCHPTWTVISNN